MSERKYLKPGWFMRKIINPLVTKTGQASELTVAGRAGGEPHSVPISPIEVDGKLYLVGARGETDWVRNLRDAGEGTLRHERKTFKFTATELTGDEQVRIVEEYREQLGKVVANYFQQLPDPLDHPAFLATKE